MRKYLTVFAASWQNEFTYRLNFVLWRFRVVLRILMTFFLWHAIYLGHQTAFGYTREQMMAYVFLALVVSTFVMAAPSNDNIGGEIGSGDLSNYLVKPLNYLTYWLTRDWASKLLNMLFVVFEVALLWLLLKPQIALAQSPVLVALGVVGAVMGAFIYFFVTKLAVMVAFWAPEGDATWGLMFLFLVLWEVLSGATFPLHILPNAVFNLIKLTPFPYMVYFPLTLLGGRTDIVHPGWILVGSAVWLAISYLLVRRMWWSGLMVYQASGR